jgi:hypothetical protein
MKLRWVFSRRRGMNLPFGSRPGELTMPSKIDVYQIGVWFCVGFFTGAGWAVASWLVGRVFSAI